MDKRIFTELVRPSHDSPQWMAFLVIKEKYRDTTYMSRDGYTVDGIVNYRLGIGWSNGEIYDTKTKEVYEYIDFYQDSTTIINKFLRALGESETTIAQWLKKVK